MAENFPNQKKETYNQIQETDRVPNKISLNRYTPRHTVIKITKVKDKETILKTARKKPKELYTREFLYGYKLIFLQEHCRPKEGSMIYFKC